MTVAELIAELQKMPSDLPVELVYDSAVRNCDIALVKQWHPDAYMHDNDKGPLWVGLFDNSSADEIDDPNDDRVPR